MNMARLERARGNLIEARKDVDAALAGVEKLRTSVKSYQLRASFIASLRKYREFDIDLLMRLHEQHPTEGYDGLALQASESGRARSLLEMISEAGTEIRQGVDSALVERERQLREQISAQAGNRSRLLSGPHTEAQVAAITKEIDRLDTEYDQVQTRIRQTSPRYAALTQPVPLDLKQIQSDLLDDKTALLEYALGAEGSFV